MNNFLAHRYTTDSYIYFRVSNSVLVAFSRESNFATVVKFFNMVDLVPHWIWMYKPIILLHLDRTSNNDWSFSRCRSIYLLRKSWIRLRNSTNASANSGYLARNSGRGEAREKKARRDFCGVRAVMIRITAAELGVHSLWPTHLEQQ